MATRKRGRKLKPEFMRKVVKFREVYVRTRYDPVTTQQTLTMFHLYRLECGHTQCEPYQYDVVQELGCKCCAGLQYPPNRSTFVEVQDVE